jgi:hypothetical protein
MLLRGIMIETMRKVGACVIAVSVLWQVAERAGRGNGEAVVHVTESGVVVLIDGYAYPYEPWPASPIACSLRPGSHTLAMTLEGRVVYEETFTLEPGGHVVLTAWDKTRSTLPQERKLSTER